MNVFYVIIPAAMTVISLLALIYSKAFADEIVRQNKRIWGINLDPVMVRFNIFLVMPIVLTASIASTIQTFKDYYPFNF
ncbi:MAG: hypothetical protein ACM3ZE_24850 [Myxococcales bacterium]